MRISSRCIIIKDEKVLMIYRENQDMKYYVFPGGKIETNETKEECIIRECQEELGIIVKPIQYVYEVHGENFIQHFFVCEHISGEIGTGNPKEYIQNRKTGIQVPMFVNINQMNNLNIVSPAIKKQFLEDYKNNPEILRNKILKIFE